MNNATPATAAVQARGLVKRYENGRIAALDGVDLDIASGEFTAICGPSGCGKSTLLNMISAIDRPDSGALRVCGEDLAQMTSHQSDSFRRNVIGLVFQLHNLIPQFTATENVQIPLIGGEIPGPQRVMRAMELLRRVGLGDRLGARPPTLSGGERQRVAICRALVNRPRVLLADEPTGALDSRSGDALFDLLDELRKETGMTLIVVTHDPRVAARAQRTLHMLDGRISA
ncbi:MAG: ABC transporter ATP-binding protein [Phycisphaerales bacterium]|nr:ABC transporter ATP-binding protein [Phycisphaerales bacterium]